MKKFSVRFSAFTLFLVVFFSNLNAQISFGKNFTLYLVRHAEKDTGNNPPLNKAGFDRAQSLYDILKKKKITRIYVTQYLRTQQTAHVLQTKNNLDTVIYKADETGESLEAAIMQKKDSNSRILVVGHSNTLYKILTKFGINSLPNDIPSFEFDNLFVLTFLKRKPKLKPLKYGTTSTQ
jgi:phosphohistidine phosphatase SixA